MQSKWTLFFIVLTATFLHAYKAFHSSGIRGKLSPGNSVHSIKAINGADTIEARVENSAFMLEGKPGLYTIIINSKLPERNVVIQSVNVSPGKTFDVGEIKLLH